MEGAAPSKDDTQLLAIHEALDKLAAQNRVQAEVVKLRYFVGMSVEETAQAIGISARSAAYYWAHTRAWLYQEIGGTRPPSYAVSFRCSPSLNEPETSDDRPQLFDVFVFRKGKHVVFA